MKTRTLLLTAAAMAAGAVTSMAQTVYSVNVVGYHTVTIAANTKTAFACQLTNSTSYLTNWIPQASAPANFQIWKHIAGSGWAKTMFIDEITGEWSGDVDLQLFPGEGGFAFNPGAAMNVVFTGDVMQGPLTNTLPTGISLRSSVVPQSGGLSSVLGYPKEANNQIWFYKNTAGGVPAGTGWVDSYYVDEISGNWTRAADGAEMEPSPLVGQPFLASTPAGNSHLWGRVFNVGP